VHSRGTFDCGQLPLYTMLACCVAATASAYRGADIQLYALPVVPPELARMRYRVARDLKRQSKERKRNKKSQMFTRHAATTFCLMMP
jgi:hypothetical protein